MNMFRGIWVQLLKLLGEKPIDTEIEEILKLGAKGVYHSNGITVLELTRVRSGWGDCCKVTFNRNLYPLDGRRVMNTRCKMRVTCLSGSPIFEEAGQQRHLSRGVVITVSPKSSYRWSNTLGAELLVECYPPFSLDQQILQ